MLIGACHTARIGFCHLAAGLAAVGEAGTAQVGGCILQRLHKVLPEVLLSDAASDDHGDLPSILAEIRRGLMLLEELLAFLLGK